MRNPEGLEAGDVVGVDGEAVLVASLRLLPLTTMLNKIKGYKIQISQKPGESFKWDTRASCGQMSK